VTAIVWRRRLATSLAISQLLPMYIMFGLLKHLVPLRALARLAWRDPVDDRHPERERLTVARIVKTRQLFPLWDGDCVQKSLLLYRELSSAGADPILAVGFRRTDGLVQGHTWIVVDGVAVDDRLAAAGEFTSSFCFGRRGRLIRE
jgi:Transglutaminase-like superfamily